MKNNFRFFKRSFLVIILLFALITIYALLQTEPPRFVLFLGRFHPLVLHLPIGSLVVAFLLEVLSRFQKSNTKILISSLLGFTTIFAILASFLGYFLSFEGGYQEDTLDLHFYTGIASAIIIAGLYFLSAIDNVSTKKAFFPLFVLGVILLSFAGHFGSVLTHGENFLTEYARPAKTERFIDRTDSLRLYNDVVHVIFKDKCLKCHNDSKQKGEFSMMSISKILDGGQSGLSIVPGVAEESLLFNRLLLPISEKEHMPPEGKSQLTKDEIWLIKYWINQGAEANEYVSEPSGKPELNDRLKKYLVLDEVEIPKASKKAISELSNRGYRITEQVPGASELIVKLEKSKPSKKDLDQLSKLEEQIVELDLSQSQITDEMTQVIQSLENLKILRINSPLITDLSLKNMTDCSRLEVLNLYQSAITSKGLEQLLDKVKPRRIYTSGSKVTESEIDRLQNEYGISIFGYIPSNFIESSQLEAPEFSHARTIFEDTLHVRIESRLKDVEIRYTVDGTDPDSAASLIADQILLNESQTLRTAAFKKGWDRSETVTKEYRKVTDRISNFKMLTVPREPYDKPELLFDLGEGSLKFNDGFWTGFFGDDLITIVDMGEADSFEHLSFQTLEDVGSWILFPKEFIVLNSSSRNGKYKEVGRIEIPRSGEGGEPESRKINLDLAPQSGRFYKIIIRNHKVLPEWHPSAGNPSWLFVDEIYFW